MGQVREFKENELQTSVNYNRRIPEHRGLLATIEQMRENATSVRGVAETCELQASMITSDTGCRRR